MPLPKIEHPLYEIYVKSLDKKIKFRPFLVREEKVLLIAKESKDPDEIKLAIKQIINNCAQDPIDVDALPLFDVEMLFLKLRAKSVGENVKLVYNCQNEVDGQPCNTDTNYTLDLNKIKYELPEGHDPKVMITDTVGVRLKYPTLSMNISINEGEDEYSMLLKVILDNIDYIFDKDSVYKPEDISSEELVAFLEGLSLENMQHIQHFFETSPKVVLEDDVTCKKCGYVHHIHTEDLLSFFT